MTRMAIIGASGFIGRALHRACLSAGIDAIPADHQRREGAHDAIHPVDVTDAQSVRALLAKTRPDAVVALAAFGPGARGLAAGADADPARAVDVNVRGLAVLLQECAAASCSRLVLASSTTVYGPARCYDSTRVPETVPLLPATAYGATKAAAEQIAYALAPRLGVRVAALRLPLVYGAERWYGGALEGLVAFAGAVAAGEPASIRAGTRRTDWMHADDAAGSLLAAATTSEAEGPYNVVGHTGSVADLACAIAAHATAPVHVDEEPREGPDLPLVDDRRARQALPLTIQHDSAVSGAGAYISELGRLT